MWCRVLTFCFLVGLVIFVVSSSIHGRPVVYLFFQRCCEDDIENEHIIVDNIQNNFLREKIIGSYDDIEVNTENKMVFEFNDANDTTEVYTTENYKEDESVTNTVTKVKNVDIIHNVSNNSTEDKRFLDNKRKNNDTQVINTHDPKSRTELSDYEDKFNTVSTQYDDAYDEKEVTTETQGLVKEKVNI